MGHHDPLQTIDYEKCRAQCLETVAEYRIRDHVAKAVEHFITTQWPARPDKRVAEKVAESIWNWGESGSAPRPSVRIFKNALTWNGQQRYTLFVTAPGVPQEMEFMVVMGEDGKPDMENTLVGHRRWGYYADEIEKRLPGLRTAVNDFNHYLGKLREAAKEFGGIDGKAPDGHYAGSIHPLSDYFHWYQLTSPAAK